MNKVREDIPHYNKVVTILLFSDTYVQTSFKVFIFNQLKQNYNFNRLNAIY